MLMNPLQEDTFTLDKVASEVGGPLGNTYKSVGFTIVKAIGKFIYGTIRTILYLVLLIPQLVQLVVFGLFLFIISKLWGVMKIIYEIGAGMFNILIPGPLIAWNVIATIFNIIGMAMKIVGMSLPKLPIVKNPFGFKLPKKMPTAMEFVMLILSPVAMAAKKTAHDFVYT
jgi:hypothetical protein